ncbi:hypothetical protein PoB_005258300 [Plakobranchus ocellatus]|uniref:Uncharacterized protein n=1 Tax=Plakobranchus ocellatus TaxID=259542 RepID=A0AAV4C2D9_9GAST|nr:hypothetical protein PoB_005258300 [Plakobranchus ocellatus]
MAAKSHNIVVIDDLEKAYDRWRTGCYVKLQECGVKGRMYGWVKLSLRNASSVSGSRGHCPVLGQYPRVSPKAMLSAFFISRFFMNKSVTQSENL